MGKMLISYERDFSRMGTLSYVGAIDEEDYEMLQSVIREDICIYVHEALGKHSEITLYLRETDIVVLSRDQREISLFQKWFPYYVGNFDLVGSFRDKYDEYIYYNEAEEEDEE